MTAVITAGKREEGEETGETRKRTCGLLSCTLRKIGKNTKTPWQSIGRKGLALIGKDWDKGRKEAGAIQCCFHAASVCRTPL